MSSVSTKREDSGNILFWPRAAGLGDLFTVLAAGAIAFRAESFLLVCGRHSKIISEFPNYLNYFKEIVAACDLCSGVEFIGLQNEEEVKTYSDELRTRSKHVFVIQEGADHGKQILNEHAKYILASFKQYFNPCSKIVNQLCAAVRNGPLICVHLRVADTSRCNAMGVIARNVDLQKWISFILWIVGTYEMHVCIIGDSDQTSPFYIHPDLLKKLWDNPRITLLPWDKKSSLTDDMAAIKESDIFIGTRSGPSALALLLGKATLLFDWGVTDALFYARVPNVQRKYFMSQNLAEMQSIFAEYYDEVFQNMSQDNIEKEFEKYSAKVNSYKSLHSYFDLKEDRYIKSYENTFFDLAKGLLACGNYQKAEECLSEIKTFGSKDGLEVYSLARAFKDGSHFTGARHLFALTYKWAAYVKRNDVIGAIYFHLGEIDLLCESLQDAKNNFIQCLQYIPSHRKAACFIKLLEAVS